MSISAGQMLDVAKRRVQEWGSFGEPCALLDFEGDVVGLLSLASDKPPTGAVVEHWEWLAHIAGRQRGMLTGLAVALDAPLVVWCRTDASPVAEWLTLPYGAQQVPSGCWAVQWGELARERQGDLDAVDGLGWALHQAFAIMRASAPRQVRR